MQFIADVNGIYYLVSLDQERVTLYWFPPAEDRYGGHAQAYFVNGNVTDWNESGNALDERTRRGITHALRHYIEILARSPKKNREQAPKKNRILRNMDS